MEKGKKTKDLNECNKEYMSKLNFNEARMIFLLKSNMIETKANFKGQFLNNLKCEICGKEEETTQHLFECDGYMEIRRNIIIEDTPMKTLRRNNIKAVAEVLSEITEKRRIMEERKNPVAKKKTEGKQKDEKKKNTLNKPPLLCEQSAALRMEEGDDD